MKIARVAPVRAGQFLYVRIETECGLVGWGESGAWGHLEASAAAIEKFAEYLVGQDPRTIELHWNIMQRFAHFRGNATDAMRERGLANWGLTLGRQRLGLLTLNNHPAFLQPQWNTNGTPASPRIYRALYQAGYAGLVAGGLAQPKVLLGDAATVLGVWVAKTPL